MTDTRPIKWLDTPEQWDRAIAACQRLGIMGLDTETYGHDVKTSSPAHRAVVHVWSIALGTGALSPRGYQRARGAVLPADALDYGPWRALLGDVSVRKVLHNAGHDAHAIANRYSFRKLGGTGVVDAVHDTPGLAGWVDTLDATRLILPGRTGATGGGSGGAGGGGYDLKALSVDILGHAPRESFKQLTSTEVEVHKPEWAPCPHPDHQVTGAADTCRLRSKGHGRIKTDRIEKREGPMLPIESIVPGHERFGRLLDYAAADATDALELYWWLDKRQARIERPPVPWA